MHRFGSAPGNSSYTDGVPYIRYSTTSDTIFLDYVGISSGKLVAPGREHFGERSPDSMKGRWFRARNSVRGHDSTVDDRRFGRIDSGFRRRVDTHRKQFRD